MNKLPYVESYKDLLIYKKARKLSWEIYKLSKKFPPEEAYSLTSQIRRSSQSIEAQIAEAWTKRTYKKHFISKLTDSDAEVNETEHWIDIAYDCGYTSKEYKQKLIEECREIGRLIDGMISKADSFYD